jgi:hypothetical protein
VLHRDVNIHTSGKALCEDEINSECYKYTGELLTFFNNIILGRSKNR